MPRTMGEDREQHTVNFFKSMDDRLGTYQWLQDFARDNGLDDMGQAIEELCRFYRQMLVDYPVALNETRLAEEARQVSEELVSQYQEQVAGYESRIKWLQTWEQHAAQAERIPYLPVQAAKQLLEVGMGAQDIYDLHELIQAAGIPAAELTRTLKQIGNAVILGRKLQQEIETLTAQKAALEKQFKAAQVEVHDTLATAAGRLKALEAQETVKAREITSTDETVARVRQMAGQIEQAYRLAGIILQGPIHMEASQYKVNRLEHLPPASLELLAGLILTIRETIHGDRQIILQPHGERIVKVPVLLSEIPGWLGPVEAYRPQVELILRQMEAMAGMEEGEE